MSLQSPELWNVNIPPPGSPKSRDVFICPTYYWLGQSRDWEIWKTKVDLLKYYWLAGRCVIPKYKVLGTFFSTPFCLNSVANIILTLYGEGVGAINKWSFSHSTRYSASLRALIPKTTIPVLTSIAAILPSQVQKTHIYDHSKNLRTWLKPMQNGNR